MTIKHFLACFVKERLVDAKCSLVYFVEKCLTATMHFSTSITEELLVAWPILLRKHLMVARCFLASITKECLVITIGGYQMFLSVYF